MATDSWRGPRVTQARAAIAAQLPLPCSKCGRTITPDDNPNTWHLDHIPPRALLPPDQWWDPTHHHVACASCNRSAGATLGNHLRGQRRAAAKTNRAVFSPGEPRRSAPARYLSPAADGPRFLSGPHPNAVGSLAGDAGLWLVEQGIRLRPWQELVFRRGLEVDAAGELCWSTVVVSTPRQQGKSVLIQALAMLRGGRPDLFGGEPQQIIHSAGRHREARRIHQLAWTWARARGLVVHQQLGGEQVIWADGGCWDAMTLASVYGASAHLVLLDELWEVPQDAYFQGVLPTQAARDRPQLWAFSTANPLTSDLPGVLMGDARAGVGDVMLADWGARPGQDFDDPAVWESVAAFWDERRAKRVRLAAGKPGFASQWLNVWPDVDDAGRWLPGSVTDRARGRVGDAPESALMGVEVTQDGRRWAVAGVWGHGTTKLRARVWVVESARAAALLCGSRRVWAHPAVANHPDLVRRRTVQPVNTSIGRAATTELREVLVRGLITVAGVDDAQWAAVRTAPADGGEVIHAPKSVGDVHAVKALSWAVWAVQSERNHLGLVL